MLLSAGGHTLVTDQSPSWWVLAVGTVIASALIAPLSGRRKSLAFGAVLLSVLQVALHTFFTLAMPSAGMSHHSMAGQPHMVMPASGMDPAAPSGPMLGGHALAALCAAWLLRRGDIAVSQLCSLAGNQLAVAVRALLRAVAGRAASLGCRLQALARLLRCPPQRRKVLGPGWASRAGAHVLTRRGPPVGFAVST
ncbi:hypothetical protein ABT119_35275 [Streptomyces sp. NPDC001910]|uniref:hypothetical protein n=1 Tax=Streptomyces sp. NPDC001910 TaxID=3154403 RepID=UPI00332BE373